ncbi:unnamed protein product [Rhizophagus irregularis]|nr:unnamed protein product [Rhizophagus irregularis]
MENQLTFSNTKTGKLIPMPQVPIARATVVAEIVRQLGNWNIETHQMGESLRLKADLVMNSLPPGTSVELDFWLASGKIITANYRENIHSWRWNENNTVRHYEHGWRSMNTWVSGQEILPGFELDVEMIEESILQQDSGSSSSDDDTRFPCPKCTETFTNNHRFTKHFRIEHALKPRKQRVNHRLSCVLNVVKKKLCSSLIVVRLILYKFRFI